MRSVLRLALLCASVFALTAFVQAQDDDWCDDGWDDDDRYRHCEVREFTLDADRSEIIVDGGNNGGISVKGWDRNEILVRAKVQASARTREDAEELAEKVEIETGRTIEADGPTSTGRKSWYSVSFEVFAPYESNLDLETHNGGISIEEIQGDVDFEALNGGVKLAALAGDVRGSTTNGGLKIELTGSEWDGDGLDVQTTNGGITIRVPEDYSAELESGTTNGQIQIDFPVMVEGRIGREISATLGDGGAPIRAKTTNGGVKVTRR